MTPPRAPSQSDHEYEKNNLEDFSCFEINDPMFLAFTWWAGVTASIIALCITSALIKLFFYIWS